MLRREMFVACLLGFGLSIGFQQASAAAPKQPPKSCADIGPLLVDMTFGFNSKGGGIKAKIAQITQKMGKPISISETGDSAKMLYPGKITIDVSTASATCTTN